MDQPARIGVRHGEPQAQDDGLVRPLGEERLPGIGERALADMRFESGGDAAHVRLGRCWRSLAVNDVRARFAPPTKFQTSFARVFQTMRAGTGTRSHMMSQGVASALRHFHDAPTRPRNFGCTRDP
ncbi:hypothetical protein BRAS3809_210002 [Bradyrhizobium sp. STM 3809]|nr:hypothetical protein BRAS3809_210002 [Bradyrhizobium sp. STM 3809]